MTDYIDLDEFKQRTGITLATHDVRILEHIAAASAKVDAVCHRSFGKDAEASERVFRPLNCWSVLIDDAWEIESVEVDNADDGSYSTTWLDTDYETDPANGIGPTGAAGWPATVIRSFGGVEFPRYNQRQRSVKVTAKWGWAAVPAAVVEATYLLANRLFYEVSVPGGVTPPNLEFGLSGASLQRPYTAEGLLTPYVRADKAIGIAG